MTRVIHDEIDALDQTLHRLDRFVAGKCPEETEFYGYVALPLSQFLDGLKVCTSATGRRFLDVGCGIGRALLIAYLTGWDVTGIEHHLPYADVARRLIPEAEIIGCKANDFDRYGDFDVVYSYRLCVNDDDQEALEKLIVSQMKSGAIAFFGHRSLKTPMQGEPLGANCWRV